MSGLFTRLARNAAAQPRNLVSAVVNMPYQQGADLFPAHSAHPHAEVGPDVSQGTAQLFDGPTQPPPFNSRTRVSDIETSATDIGLQQTSVRLSRSGSDDGAAQTPTVAARSGETAASIAQTRPEVLLPGSGEVVSAVTDRQNNQAAPFKEPGGSQTSPQESVAENTLSAILPDEATQAGRSTVYRPASATGLPVTGPAKPDPLLPSAAVVQLSRPVATALSPATAADSPNEVHVHIGRIEVTALQSAEPVRSKTRGAQPAMSLEDYLLRRQRD